MTGRAVAARSACGTRLHLQHGPIDLLIKADGDRECAFAAATARFATVLEELVAELPLLRSPLLADSKKPRGEVALRMDAACRIFTDRGFITRMAAVAGSVADEVLAAMVARAPLRRAMVNNGGDIALHLARRETYAVRMRSVTGDDLGDVVIRGGDRIGGIATSGRHGRSFSLGIADSVTVLARSGAVADAAATMVANAVDLPDHPGIHRVPAFTLTPDSDLGSVPVVVRCGTLTAVHRAHALNLGLERAEQLVERGTVIGCALFLQGEARVCGVVPRMERDIAYA